MVPLAKPTARLDGRVAAASVHAPGRLVVVSPHLDDAVLSAFELLLRATSATVISVFAGVPDASVRPAEYDRLTRSSDPRARVTARRIEDRRVLTTLGARHVHLDLLDAPYRSEDPTADAVAAAIAAALPDHDTLVLPAAIGGHPDHVLTREAALCLPASRLRLAIADLPYSAVFGWPASVTGVPDPAFLDPSAIWEPALDRLAEAAGHEPEMFIYRLSAAARRDKLAAVRGYATQFWVQEGGPSRGITHRERVRFEVAWRI